MSGIQIKNLSLRLGHRQILDEVKLEAQAGDFIVLAGPSGSGKSSLLRCIAGLHAISAGEIRRGDERLDLLPPGRRDIAMVFQDHALMPHLDVLGNLTFGLRARGIKRDKANQRAHEVAERLGLQALLKNKPAQISGGEQQRVALGRAMLRDAKLVLMDEPLSSLDAPLRVRLRQEILDLHKALGWTTIYVTHDQTEAMSMADRLGILIDGRLQQLAAPQDVYRRPASVEISRFIGAGQTNLLPVEQADTGLRLATESTKLLLALRPESLRLQAGEADICMQVRLCEKEFRGDRIMLHCESQGHELRVLTAEADGLSIGQVFSVGAALQDCRLFDRASGQAVEAQD